MVWHVAIAAIRALVAALFIWHVATVSYLPLRHQPFGDDDSEAAVRALNAGYPFHLLYPATATSPHVLSRMNQGVVDHGVMILLTAGTAAYRTVTGTRVTVTASMGRGVLMAVFLVTAAAMMSPGVPLLVGLAGIVALDILLTWGPLGVVPAVHWGVAFAAVVVGVYLGTVLQQWSPTRVFTAIVLAIIAAITQILRQEAVSVAYGLGFALIVGGAIVAFVVRRAPPVATRAIAGGLLLIAMNASIRPIERLAIARVTGNTYAETAAIEHGFGGPLYLSLGYVSNPFNLAWRDPIAQVHALLIDPAIKSAGPEIQAMLLREFATIVINRPWLLIRNVVARAERIHALATQRSERLPDVAVWQRPPLARLYKSLPLVVLLSVALVWWRGTVETALIVLGAIAIAGAASAGALVVFPDYIGGVQGAIVMLALILPAAVVSHLAGSTAAADSLSTSTARRVLVCAAALGVAALLVAAAFVAVQWLRYRGVQERTADRDPLEAIAADQFRYAHVFNDLSVAKQGRLVARLTASNDPRIARIIDLRRGDFDLFRPEVLVRTATQLHLIAWMGRSFHAPFPPLYQGTTHSLFFICGECAPQSTVNDFPFDSGWTFVNDLEWRGRYRMFSVSLNAKLEAARFFHVAAEKIVALDSSIESTGLRPALISSARIDY
jgi:hypothetical protein